MAGGHAWTEDEDAYILGMVRDGHDNRAIRDAFNQRWPGRRGASALLKRRSMLVSGTVPVPQAAPSPIADISEKPDETITTDLDDDIGQVMVAASASIKTPEELFERSGLDPEVWEIAGDSTVRKWDIAMKVDDRPVIIPCHYVAIKVRKRWEHSSLPMPVVLKVTRPRKVKPSEGVFTSVHWSDIHFPHHDPQAVNVLYQILDYTNPGIIADQGDTIDATELSKYPKDPYHRIGMKEEIAMGAEHLGIVHALTPDADHYWLEGNHEERLKRTIWGLADQRAAGEILTLPAVREVLSWPSLLGIGALGWDVVSYPDHRVLFDTLVVCHGEAAQSKVGASEAAELKRYGRGGLSGHTHRIGYASDRKYDDELQWHGLGCMCRIRGAKDGGFVSFPNWKQGFCVLSWSSDRKHYSVERVRINDGVAYFRGKRFVGDSKAFGALAV
jgi:hypothetical protein